ncbi:MAG: hypothetical protein PVI15_04100 [Chromatiales bacterium]|jgi:hypothetical protein
MQRHWHEQLIEEAEKGLDDLQAGRLKSVAELWARYRSSDIKRPNTLPQSVGLITPDEDPLAGGG